MPTARCSVDGCTNYEQKGGVCKRHGAKVKRKRCSVDGCPNLVQRRGVCIRHGAKHKRCSVYGCPNQAKRRGVCKRHGAYSDGTPRANIQVQNNLGRDDRNTASATPHDAGGTQPQGVDRTAKANSSGLLCFTHGTSRPTHPNQNYFYYQQPQQQKQQQQQMQQQILRMGPASAMPSLDDRHQQQFNNYYYNSFQNSSWTSRCSFQGCATMAGSFCWIHRYAADPLAQANVQFGYIQGGGNQNNVTTSVEIISDDEDGEKKQFPIASRKRKAGCSKESETAATSNDTRDKEPDESEQEITGNKDAAPEMEKNKPDSSSAGEENNLNDDKEQDTLDMMIPRERTRGEVNRKDDEQKATSDVAPTQEGEGTSDMMEDGDSWGGDGQNEYDCGDINVDAPDEYESNESNDCEETGDENQSRVDLEEGAAAKMVEKAGGIMEPNNMVEASNARPEAMADQYEGDQSRSKSECEKRKLELKDLHTQLKDVMSELEEKSETQARLKLLWRRKEEELNSQIKTSNNKLKELNNQVEDLSAELILLKAELGEAERNEAVTRAKLVEMANDFKAAKALSESAYEQQQSTIHELRASLKDKESEIHEKSETASRSKANLRLKEVELNAHMQTSAVKLKEMTTEVATLNAKLAEATRNEAALSAQLKRMTDDFAAARASSKSVHEQQQSTIEDLCARLKERESELNENSERAARLAADLRSKEAELITQMQISADELKEAASDIDAIKARLREANINEVSLNEQLKEMRDKFEADIARCESRREQEKSTNDELHISLRDKESELLEKSESLSKFEAELRKKEAEMKEMAREVDVLKAKLGEANNNEALLSDHLKRAADDFEAARASFESTHEQQQSKIDELSARLNERESELSEKFETAATLASDLRSKEGETKEMSTEEATLSLKLAEGSDVAKLKTEMEGAQAELETLKGALDIVTAEVCALKKNKDMEESTTNSPKRVQPLRRSKRHRKSSLEATVVDQSRKSTGGTNKTYDDEETPEELLGLDKELVQMILNEIVDSGEKVKFGDIAGLDGVKEAVDEMVIFPMERPDLFTGLRACPKGLLLFGPPGTGKTMIGKVIAHKSGATFFSISSSSLASKWHGDGEKLVKTLFAVASYRAPSVIFIDEVDSLLSQRKTDESEVSRKMKTEFLVQLDGANNERSGRVLVIGATNLPQELDDAARRRFVKRLYIPLPDQSAREVLLRNALKKNDHLLTDIEFAMLSRDTEGYSGADLKNLCTDAAMWPMRSLRKRDRRTIHAKDLPPITYEHFCQSLKGSSPSVARADLEDYIEWNNTYGTKVSSNLYDEDSSGECSDDETDD